MKNLLKDAAKEGFKATYLLGGGDMGDEIAENFAKKFSEKAYGPLADAIQSYVQNAKISGQNALVSSIISTSFGGPCSGVLTFTGTELSIS